MRKSKFLTMPEGSYRLKKIIVLEISNSMFSERIFDATLNLVRQLNKDFPLCNVEYHGLIEDDRCLSHSYVYYCDVVKCDVIMTVGGIGFMSKSIITDCSYKAIDLNVTEKISSMIVKKDELNAILMFAGVRGKTLILNFPWSREVAEKYAQTIQPILQILHELAVKESVIVRPEEFSSIFEFSPPKHINHRESYYMVIDVAEAIAFAENILSKHAVREVIYVPSAFSFGYVCAENVLSYRMVPANSICLKNGYACFEEDGLNERRIIAKNARGDSSKTLPQNACYYIEKGEVVNQLADCIIPIRDADVLKDGSVVRPKILPQKYKHIKQKGSDLKTHDIIISARVQIRHNEISTLTTFQREKVLIYTKPCVGILSVGHDLKLVTEFELNNSHLREFCICNLKNIFGTHHMICNDFGLVTKNTAMVMEALERAFRNNDILIFTVRENSNDKDFVKSIIFGQYTSDIVYEHVNMTPGDQTTFGTCLFNSKRKYFYFISGNLVSALTACHLILVPSLIYWSGVDGFNFSVLTVCIDEDIRMEAKPKYVFATLMHTVNHNYARAKLLNPNKKKNGVPHYEFDIILEIPRIMGSINILRRGTLVQAFSLPKF